MTPLRVGRVELEWDGVAYYSDDGALGIDDRGFQWRGVSHVDGSEVHADTPELAAAALTARLRDLYTALGEVLGDE